MQGLRDLKGNGDPAAGYPEDNYIASIGQLSQLRGQLLSSVLPVFEDHRIRSVVPKRF
jgi:hypothetical protein